MTNSARRWRKRRESFPARRCATKSGTDLRRSLYYHQSEFGDEAGYKKLAERLDKTRRGKRHARQPAFLFRGLARSVRDDHREPAEGRAEQSARRQLGAGHSGETVRDRSRLRAPPQRGGAEGLLRKPDLPDRSFPRERDGAEYFGPAFRERDFRAALECALHRSRPDHGRGNARRGRIAPVITKARARCATWCRIICSNCSASSAMEAADRSRRRQHSR